MNKRKKQTVAKRICAVRIGMLMLAMISFGGTVLGTVNANAQTTDYSKYSTTKHDWYIVRAKNHEKAKGGVPAGMKLSDYNSYYMNTKTDENVIYLSFDCGYDNGYTEKILKTLKKHNAKAIFFVTGGFIRHNPELIIKMKEQGHLVGNHTWSHPDMSAKTPEQINHELRRCEEAMKEATGYPMDPFFRPPMGCYSARCLKAAQDRGYRTIFWSMAYADYDEKKQPGKDYVVNHFKANYHKGALPLIHATSSSSCAALDDVLTFLESQNYRFGTVDEFSLPKGTLKIACKSKVYDGKPAEIKVRKNTNKNAKITFTITNAKGKQVKEAVKPGTYTVVAQADSNWTYRRTASNTVTFEIKSPVKLNKTEKVLNVGKSCTLKLKNAEGTVKWESSKPSVATVNAKGEVKAVRSGTATITATNKKKTYKCKIKVENPRKPDNMKDIGVGPVNICYPKDLAGEVTEADGNYIWTAGRSDAAVTVKLTYTGEKACSYETLLAKYKPQMNEEALKERAASMLGTDAGEVAAEITDYELSSCDSRLGKAIRLSFHLNMETGAGEEGGPEDAKTQKDVTVYLISIKDYILEVDTVAGSGGGSGAVDDYVKILLDTMTVLREGNYGLYGFT